MLVRMLIVAGIVVGASAGTGPAWAASPAGDEVAPAVPAPVPAPASSGQVGTLPSPVPPLVPPPVPPQVVPQPPASPPAAAAATGDTSRAIRIRNLPPEVLARILQEALPPTQGRNNGQMVTRVIRASPAARRALEQLGLQAAPTPQVPPTPGTQETPGTQGMQETPGAGQGAIIFYIPSGEAAALAHALASMPPRPGHPVVAATPAAPAGTTAGGGTIRR